MAWTTCVDGWLITPFRAASTVEPQHGNRTQHNTAVEGTSCMLDCSWLCKSTTLCIVNRHPSLKEQLLCACLNTGIHFRW